MRGLGLVSLTLAPTSTEISSSLAIMFLFIYHLILTKSKVIVVAVWSALTVSMRHHPSADGLMHSIHKTRSYFVRILELVKADLEDLPDGQAGRKQLFMGRPAFLYWEVENR